jgi:hypothetical protein
MRYQNMIPLSPKVTSPLAKGDKIENSVYTDTIVAPLNKRGCPKDRGDLTPQQIIRNSFE